ncbi:hypothetical protein B0T22DRAFT_483202 [Podospora appendiculata]|uniref:Uncharacterized protein n=1 Tax=Podospora appendiculata TaxID=314037 RepID=A0AAE1C8Q8_9PEZI|nr:hypothetical protein B0T22DRAFT_483202 [Podospora appendiculata]
MRCTSTFVSVALALASLANGQVTVTSDSVVPVTTVLSATSPSVVTVTATGSSATSGAVTTISTTDMGGATGATTSTAGGVTTSTHTVVPTAGAAQLALDGPAVGLAVVCVLGLYRVHASVLRSLVEAGATPKSAFQIPIPVLALSSPAPRGTPQVANNMKRMLGLRESLINSRAKRYGDGQTRRCPFAPVTRQYRRGSEGESTGQYSVV